MGVACADVVDQCMLLRYTALGCVSSLDCVPLPSYSDLVDLTDKEWSEILAGTNWR